MLPYNINLKKLAKLLNYIDKFNITIEIWTTGDVIVYIYTKKQFNQIFEYQSDFDDAIDEALKFLNKRVAFEWLTDYEEPDLEEQLNDPEFIKKAEEELEKRGYDIEVEKQKLLKFLENYMKELKSQKEN